MRVMVVNGSDTHHWLYIHTIIGHSVRVMYRDQTPILIVQGRYPIARLAATEATAVQMRRIRSFCGPKLPKELSKIEMFERVNQLLAEVISNHIDHHLTKGTEA